MNAKQTFDEVYTQIKRYKVPFLAVFFFVVLVTYGFLYAIDFIPEPASAEEVEVTQEPIEEVALGLSEPEEEEVVELSPLPIKIIFDSLDKEVKVLNPESRDVAELDAALLNGVVRHPDSAEMTEKGNVFILGHSSYLPTVFNKNYQAFNGIQDLTWGDTIRVQTADAEYVYRVQKVYEAKASDVVVSNTPGKAQLTLATCNSFGSKDDRFIVEANLIETKEL